MAPRFIKRKNPRLNVPKEELSYYIQDAIYCIELGTNLKFTVAEDWTATNQGHVLHFEGSLYKGNNTWDDVVRLIKIQFARHPNTKSIEEDTSDFEELDFGGKENEYLISISV